MRLIKKGLLASLILCSVLILNKTNAASISLVGSGEYLKDCPKEVKIIVDTEGEEINTVGFNLFLSNEFVVNNFDAETNGIFRLYTSPKKLQSRVTEKPQNFVRIVASSSSPNGFNGIGEFGTLTITPKKDTVNLNIYMQVDYDGEDSSVIKLNEDGTASDILSKINNLKFEAKSGECNITKLEEIKFEEGETTVLSTETEEIIEEKTTVNLKNVFDRTQETNRLKKNRLYVLIAITLIILFSFLFKKNKGKEKTKKS